jgi:serine/threonine-protein kinase
LTALGDVIGTFEYLSPEQLTGSAADARSDIWALGVILYELVAGRVPFDAQTMPLLCTMVLQDEPPPLAPRVRDLPRGFEAVVLRCLAKDRNKRFPNVHELARALAEFAPQDAQRSLDRIARLAGSDAPHSGARTLDLGYGGEQPPLASTVHPARKGWAAGVVVALLIALGAGVWRWASPSASFSPAVPAAAPAPAASPPPAPPAALASAPAVAAPAETAAPPAAAAAAHEAPAVPAGASRRSRSRIRRAAAPPSPAPPQPTAAPPAPAPVAPVKPNPLDGRL